MDYERTGSKLLSGKHWIVLFLVAGLGLLALGGWHSSYRHHINRDGYGAIQVGISEEQVGATLGRPPGDYSSGAFASFRCRCGDERISKVWVSDEGAIAIYFDCGSVVEVEYSDVAHVESLLGRFRRRLGL